MKSADISKVNLITTAINEKVANLDTTITENETNIVLTITLPKAGTAGRPRNSSALPMDPKEDAEVKA